MADLVTSAETKSYLGIDHSDDDTVIGEIIRYVTAAVERYTGRTFTQDGEEGRTEYLDGEVNELVVRMPPIDSIVGIYDTEADDTEVDAEDYDFDPEAGLVWLTGGISVGYWGAGRRRWKVVYVGGHDGAPNDVKAAALTWIADIYTHRDDLPGERLGDLQTTRSPGDMPERVKGLLSKYTDLAF